MIKTNIKMRVTPEQSTEVQEICFENGIYFEDGVETILSKIPYLFISDNEPLSYCFTEHIFENNTLEEIDPELFIRTNGTCITKREAKMKHNDKMESLKDWEDTTKNQEAEPLTRGDGGSTNYYELPKDATELRHLIRYKKMSHSIGEIFCAIYRLNDNGEYLRNLKKAKFYIDSEIEEYEKENK